MAAACLSLCLCIACVRFPVPIPLACVFGGSQLNQEKVTMENQLEAEQEYIVNKLQKKVVAVPGIVLVVSTF